MALKKIKTILKVMAILFIFLILAFVAFYFWASSGLLPEEKLSEVITFTEIAEEPPEQKETFSVMTYNIGYLAGMFNSRPVKTKKKLFEKNMERFLELVKRVKPDFIGFQEIDFNSRRSFYVDQLQTIAREGGYRYGAAAVNWDKRYVPFPYWPPSVHFGGMLSGQAVLSRFPVLSTRRVVLEKPASNPFYYNEFYLNRLVQMVKVKIAEKELIILNIHLEAYDIETREKQAQVVLDLYDSYKENHPVLVIGDFNSVPPDAVRKKGFVDEPEVDFSNDRTIGLFLGEESLRAAEFNGLTFPSDRPTRKLDYIFYTHEKITLETAFVPELGSSDHLPVVMTFSFF